MTYSMQRCGSGPGIAFLVPESEIRNKFFPDPGSNRKLSNNIWAKNNLFLCQLTQIIFCTCLKH
jgi:hypothetical protein